MNTGNKIARITLYIYQVSFIKGWKPSTQQRERERGAPVR